MITVEKVNEIIIKHLGERIITMGHYRDVERASVEIVEAIIHRMARSKSQDKRLRVLCGLTMEEKPK
jgi:hypothetical protein